MIRVERGDSFIIYTCPLPFLKNKNNYLSRKDWIYLLKLSLKNNLGRTGTQYVKVKSGRSIPLSSCKFDIL